MGRETFHSVAVKFHRGIIQALTLAVIEQIPVVGIQKVRGEFKYRETSSEIIDKTVLFI